MVEHAEHGDAVMFKSPEDDFRPMPYNNPRARPFLKGGLCCWPMPIDMNGDGRLDIVLQSWCVTPLAGTFVAENASGNGGETLFRPLRKIAQYGYGGLSCARVGGQPLVTSAVASSAARVRERVIWRAPLRGYASICDALGNLSSGTADY